MSDWSGTYQTDKPIKAGLDIEMPGPTAVRTLTAVKGALARGRISQSDIDARVRSVLGFVDRAIASGVPFNAPERTIDSPEMLALLRRAAAESIVLLKNDAALLPLDRASVGRVAVIGSNALMAAYSGGGSAQLQPLRKVTPLDGLRAALGSDAEIEVVSGVYGDRYAAEFGNLIRSPSGRSGHIRLQFFHPDRRTKLLREVETPEARIWLGDFESVPKSVEVIIEGVLQPEVSGRYEIGLACTGWAALQIDGEHMFEVSSLKVRLRTCETPS